MEVREATKADVPGIVTHVRSTLAEFGIEFGVGAQSDDELFHLPESYASRGGAFWVIADESGTVLGTAGVVPLLPTRFEVRKMYLSLTLRGKGLGAKLFDHVLAFARSRGANEIVLDTVERMTDAIAFYEKRGFVRDDQFISAPRCTRGYVLRLKES